MADWRTDILRRMGAPITPENLNFLQTWQRYEGGHTNNDASFNWLNTTRGAGRPINSVGVKAFPSYEAGIANTVATILNGRYGDIAGGLRAGDPYAADPRAGLSTWVSGSPTGNLGYAAKVLGAPPSGAPVPSAGRGTTSPAFQRPVATQRQPITLNPRVMALFGASQERDPRQQTLGILGSILQRSRPAPAMTMARRSRAPQAAPPVVSPTSGASAGSGLQSVALGGADFSNLGGPDAHHARPLGNWQSDNAWDLGVPEGTPVYAVADGTIGPRVGVQDSRPGDGARFTLVGGGNQYWYGHLSRLAVKPGQRVRRGQLVGYSGSSANGVPHLHLGVMNP